MRDRELYAMCGWRAPRARRRSAECHSPQTICDHREREWRHLDTCQLQARLHARVPASTVSRTACSDSLLVGSRPHLRCPPVRGKFEDCSACC
jgi:hypothetical protein